jgi:hypothetical protein
MITSFLKSGLIYKDENQGRITNWAQWTQWPGYMKLPRACENVLGPKDLRRLKWEKKPAKPKAIICFN